MACNFLITSTLKPDVCLGFMEALKDNTVEGNSVGLKLVPWLSWNEWNSIRHSLFSASPASVAFALQRIWTWRSRGCIPIAVDVTTAIIEIQQKDPFFRKDLGGNALQSEEMLSMLYCMAIMRLVNGVVEKTQKKAEISIAEAVNAIGIPRMLVDVRHEGSHRDLPSLQLVRVASTKYPISFSSQRVVNYGEWIISDDESLTEFLRARPNSTDYDYCRRINVEEVKGSIRKMRKGQAIDPNEISMDF
ncbi:hypothetical protein FXO37_21454 [Capsicum annuum]|nr:hypothetical protein FXO37_21454 [Capsicum annuum]